ncbi:hypothetical protein HAX54_043353 [Datura stramonium]|uniref:KIB1-4 beta-propeller domain-containing protein n=1 Tax=Datura stramonium TaxID=4076 RepID=A0ABS8W352_DATST|nr:hypothetical protein [Datura stramonium]
MIKPRNRIAVLAFLKTGNFDWVFRHLGCFSHGDICDMIYYYKRYYIVTNIGEILSVDNNTTLKFKTIAIVLSIINPCTCIKFYLIKTTTTNELLMVQITSTSSVKIFKLVTSSNTMLAEVRQLGR